jgi:hypothetical protein
MQLNGEIMWRAGQWVEVFEKQSSNRRELENIVVALEGCVREHRDTAVELFMFTDNVVTECAYFRGTSTSPIMFDLVFRLRKLELLYGWKIHMVHIAGTRIIVQGTHGLSRRGHDDGSDG